MLMPFPYHPPGGPEFTQEEVKSAARIALAGMTDLEDAFEVVYRCRALATVTADDVISHCLLLCIRPGEALEDLLTLELATKLRSHP